jgi:hypothetical protein
VKRISQLIPSKAQEISGASYSYDDTTAVSGTSYCYALQDFESDGKSTFHIYDIVSVTAQ